MNIKKLIKGVKIILRRIGIDLDIFWSTITGIPWYLSDLNKFKSERKRPADWPIRLYPIYNNRKETSGTTKTQYFLQDLYVAQEIYKNNPSEHIDIGSRIDGFVAHLATFRNVKVIDIRPLNHNISNIEFIQQDITKIQDDFCMTPSLSCLHSIEHFGLGRYNDPIEYLGYESGFKAMAKMVTTGGRFYFSTQIGPQRVEFNAHRVFNISTLLSLIGPSFKVEKIAYIDDQNELHTNVTLNDALIENNLGCNMGCIIFTLIKMDI